MTESIDLSIIIVSYNTWHVLKDCLESIENSKNLPKIEIFVVDNNSNDDTPSLLKKRFPDVNIITNSQNLGFSKANNIAIKKAKGKYILILNPDTEVMPETLTKMKDFMDNNQDVAMSTCRVELADGSLDRDCRRSFPTPWRAFCHFSKLSKIFSGSKIFDQYYMGYTSEAAEHEVDSCVGAFMLTRKSAIDKVGLLDEDFFFYGEDLDWCWRFHEEGYKIVYTPITKILHHKGAASGMKPSSKHITRATKESKRRAIAESVRAMELFYKKHYVGKYPLIITWLILTSLKVLGRVRTLST